jgi:hypothetical protein
VKLPNAELAVVAREKIVDYLLNDAHEDGQSKAAFFKSFGFSIEEWQRLEQALRNHAKDHDAVLSRATAFGELFSIRGSLVGPDGRRASVVAVWIVEAGHHRPRFVTAYPLKERG